MHLFHPALAAFSVVMVLAGPAAARAAESQASGQAEARVVTPLSVVALGDLDFGVVVGPAAGEGTVRVIPGVASALYAGGALAGCLQGACAPAMPARFSVMGEPGRTYLVTVPDILDATSGAGTAHLLVTGLEVRTASRTSEGASGQLDAAGSDGFEIGGTLRIPAGTPPARYRLLIPLVVNYG